MTDWEIEKRLKTAIENSTPPVLDSILLKCDEQKGLVGDMTETKERTEAQVEINKGANPKKKRNRILFSGAAAACLVLVAGLFGYNQLYSVDSTVEIDVNPSIELDVSKSEKVLAAAPLNDDAVIILDDMDLKGVDLDVAVNAIVGSMVKNGYIDEVKNSILVSVENQDSAKGQALQDRLTSEIDSMLKAYSVNGAVVSQTITENKNLQSLANQYGISLGKATMIQKIVDEDPTKTFESLVGASINELNLIASSKGTTGVMTVGSASTSAYIGEAKAKSAALSHAGLAESAVRFTDMHLDYDDGKVVYEIEFYKGNVEYDYEIDALTGNVVDYDSDLDDGGMAAGAPTQSKASASSSKDYIGEAKAKSIALKHVGLAESAVTFTKTKLGHDDGRAEYEVDFYSGTVEYDYEIDAISGTILDYEKDTGSDNDRHDYNDDYYDDDDHDYDDNHGQVAPANNQISADAALTTALSHAGVAKADVTGIKNKLDYDDGRAEYEIEFHHGTTEYEYKIDAATGDVLEHEAGQDD